MDKALEREESSMFLTVWGRQTTAGLAFRGETEANQSQLWEERLPNRLHQKDHHERAEKAEDP